MGFVSRALPEASSTLFQWNYGQSPKRRCMPCKEVSEMSLLAEPAEHLFGLLEQEAPQARLRIVHAAAPRETSRSSAQDDETPNSAEEGVRLGTVLIVEDDAMVAFQIEDSLQDDGFSVCGVAATARAGLALFHEFKPEFAVLDVRLAQGDGRDVAREIARLSSDTIILMCTAEDEDNLQGIGAHALLRKPFDFRAVGASLVATRCWARGEWAVKAPPQLVRLRPER
jgi:CheY-like chemotaxis protein